jgi:hypothetical protein
MSDNRISGKQIKDNSILVNTKLVADDDYEFTTATGSSIFLLSNKTISEIDVASGSVIPNKDYILNKIAIAAASASIGITVQDEGVLVSDDVVGINFIGASVLAENSSQSRYINVYIPTPNFAADFNTNNIGQSSNGTNALVITSLSSLNASQRATRNRPYTGQSALNPSASTNVDCINWAAGQNISYNSGYFTIDHPSNNELYIQVIKGGDNTILNASTCSILTSQTGSQGVTNSIITNFKIVNIQAEVNRWKCFFTANVNLQQAYISTGATGGAQFYVNIINKRISQNLTYSLVSTNNSNNSPSVWLDRELATASIGTPLISQNGLLTKALSGVNYITSGSNFAISISNINNINNGSYPTNFLELNLSQYLMSTQYITSSVLTGWTNSFSNVGASLNTNYSIGSTNNSTVNSSAAILVRAIDWSAGSYVSSSTASILIDTLTALPTRVYDDFTTESDSTYPRLQSDLTTAWVSATNLASIDSGNGLELSQSRLIYPTRNYIPYIPTNTANYTSLTGTRVWRRKLYSGNNAITYGNGIFTFSDTNITESMLSSSDLLLEIGDGTNWYSLNNSYTSGALNNGDGCRINSSNYNLTNGTKQISFTLGVLNLSVLYIKISYTDTATGKSIYIGSMSLNW